MYKINIKVFELCTLWALHKLEDSSSEFSNLESETYILYNLIDVERLDMADIYILMVEDGFDKDLLSIWIDNNKILVAGMSVLE